ncbi:hypothetical protein FXO38_33572 [Capsicum annuum]|uniref:Uncharacterized protein n=1 Tax=Capsicum annuum TaxID=4072 RepID=A0A2G2XVH1_CAPAN|nr:hypothetical protein FXO38_33572 [Capsicum annuum]PHT61439.1 hypothetical protein T459_34706 [Capsicum annuum]
MGGLLRKNLSIVGILRLPLVLTTVTWSHVLQWSSVESKSQPLNEPLLDADTTSFGFLGEMPQNFGFSDLTADFTNSSGIKMRWYDAKGIIYIRFDPTLNIRLSDMTHDDCY